MNQEQLKKEVCKAIDKRSEEVVRIAQEILNNPELGFKEKHTASIVTHFFNSLKLPVKSNVAQTGIIASLEGKEKGPNVALMGELDAVSTYGSPYANPDTGAAHTCGHHLQVAIMLAVAAAFVDANIQDSIAGTLTFMGVPAEEYVELDWRLSQVKEGKLHFLGGKQEMVYQGIFDDVQMAIITHALGNMPEAALGVCNGSNGFVGKTIHYIGKAAHAAATPHEGINALNAAMLGLMGVHALRETFRDEDHIRVHPIITKGGDTVNNVPADVRLEAYVRGRTPESIEDAHKKVDRALRAGGDAVGAKTEIQTIPGYLPLSCSSEMNDIFLDNSRQLISSDKVSNIGDFAASTDMGDISQLIPSIHAFMGGVDGTLHTPDYRVADYNAAVILPAKAVAMTIIDLMTNGAEKAEGIIERFKPSFTIEEYIKQQESYWNCQ